MASRDKTLRLCTDAMLLGFSLLLSYLEAILPLTVWISLPGFKLGLCNILITLVFIGISPVDAAIISLCRVIIMGILFGNVSSFTFSLCGGILSYLGLWFFLRLLGSHFTVIGASVGCAALHNIGQIIAASFWFGTSAVIGYLPFLLLAALLFGTVTGILLYRLLSRFETIYKGRNRINS